MRKSFTVPEQPIDRFEVYGWSLRCDEFHLLIEEKKATYYIDMSYEKYIQGAEKGGDLVDDWMVSTRQKSGRWLDTGRIPGWKSISIWNDDKRDVFVTKEEALLEAVRRYDGYIIAVKKRISHMENIRKELLKEF